MNLYALVEYSKVTQLKESEVAPDAPASACAFWVNITDNTEVFVGWGATFNEVWTFTPPSDVDLRNAAEEQKWQLLNVAAAWLILNSLQFKVDVAVASPQEQMLLIAHKNYCIAVSDIDKQAGYPVTIDWPLAPY